MKKYLVLFFILALVLCQVSFAAPQFIIKFAYVSPELTFYQNYQTNYISTFKGYVERNSQGQIEVQSYPAAQLGAEREEIEGTKMGTIEMCSVSDAPLVGFYKSGMVTALPGVFASVEEANWVLWDSSWAKAYHEDIRKALGLRTLSHYTFGFRNFTNNVKPIHVPADCKGMKFRVMESPVPIRMVEALGATAAPLASSDKYTAEKSGVVDGEENSVSAIIQDKTFEVQKYLCLDGHVCANQLVFMNDKFFNKLPKNLQEVVVKGAYRANYSCCGLIYVNEELGLKFLSKYMTIYTPTPAEAKLWQQAISGPVIKYVQTQIGDQPINALLKAIDGYRKANL